MQPEPHFIPPGSIARAINRLYGRLASLGLGPSYSYVLLTKGRKSGALHATPVNVLRHDGKLYLVGTRGHTQWSRNALAAGALTLKRGRIRMQFRVRPLGESEKAEVLKAYLRKFNWMASRFFPVRRDADIESFAALAPRYPVFELFAGK